MYKLWEVNKYPSDLIISAIRLDKGTFNTYNDAVEFAENQDPRKCSVWEIEIVHDTDCKT